MPKFYPRFEAKVVEPIIYTNVTIGGVVYNNFINCRVQKQTGEFNGASNFTLRLHNWNGQYSDAFNLNDEVIVYASTTSPATAKIFTGLIENIEFSGVPNKEDITLSGRDYSAYLMDVTVQPRIWRFCQDSLGGSSWKGCRRHSTTEPLADAHVLC